MLDFLEVLLKGICAGFFIFLGVTLLLLLVAAGVLMCILVIFLLMGEPLTWWLIASPFVFFIGLGIFVAVEDI